jgi:hypothetical protein
MEVSVSSDAKKKATRERVRTHREKLRAKGLRPVTFWLPDTRTPEFEERLRQEGRAIANSPQEADDQAFVDAISEDLFK